MPAKRRLCTSEGWVTGFCFNLKTIFSLTGGGWGDYAQAQKVERGLEVHVGLQVTAPQP